MRRRLRRRPAPRKALNPKSTKRIAPGSDDSGALRLALFSALKAVIVLVPTGAGWVGTLYPSSAPAGAPAAPGRSASPCFAAESARVGTLMSLPEGIATLGSGEVRAEGRCRPKVTSGCPKRSEGGFPVGTRTYAVPHPNALSQTE